MNATDTVFVCLLHVVSPWADLDWPRFVSQPPPVFPLFLSIHFPSAGSRSSVRKDCGGKRQHTFLFLCLQDTGREITGAFSLWTRQKFRQRKKKCSSSLRGCLLLAHLHLRFFRCESAPALHLQPVSYLTRPPPSSAALLPGFLHL